MSEPKLDETLKTFSGFLTALADISKKIDRKRSLPSLIALLAGFLQFLPNFHYPYWGICAIALILLGSFLFLLSLKTDIESAQLSVLKGSTPFGIADHADFLHLGRESEIADLISWISTEQTAVILLWGCPAAGKTSVIEAGLNQSTVKGAPLEIVYSDASQSDFLVTLVNNLWQKAGSPANLPKILANIVNFDRARSDVVFIDNAESALDRNSVVELVRTAIEAPLPYKRVFVVAMSEEEYFDHWFDLPWPRDGVLKPLEVSRFSPADAIMVGARLLSKAGIPVVPSVIEEISLDIQMVDRGKVEVSPLLLSILLQLVGRASVGGQAFDLDDYQTSGRAVGLLRDFLTHQLSNLPATVLRQIVIAIMEAACSGTDQFQGDSISLADFSQSKKLAVLKRLCSAEIRVLRREPTSDLFMINKEWLEVLKDIRDQPGKSRLEERVRTKYFLWHQGRRIYKNRRFRAMERILESRFLLSWFDLIAIRLSRERLTLGNSRLIAAYIRRSRRHRRVLLLGESTIVLLMVCLIIMGRRQLEQKEAEKSAKYWQLPGDIFTDYGDQLSGLSFDLSLNDLHWLPRKLKWLEVHCNDLNSLKDVPGELVHLSIRGTSISDLNGLPPRLEQLDISGTPVKEVESLKDLKNSRLVELDLSGLRVTDMTAIPRSVRSLKLNNVAIENLKGLPDLIDLELVGTRVQSLKYLPRSLKRLKLIGNSNLNRLDFELPNLRELETDRYTESAPLARLVTLIVANSYLKRLPENIDILELANSSFEGVLPLPLEELRIDDAKSSIPLDKLPANLKRLKIPWPPHTSFSALPKNLQLLDISRSKGVGSFTGAPPSLTKLNVTGTDLSSLDEIPVTITDLSFSLCNPSGLRSFPPQLESLNLEQCERLYSLENLPASLRTLNVSNTLLSELPQTLTKLKNLDISNTCILKQLPKLPDGLEELTLHIGQVRSLKGLPGSVRTIHFVERRPKAPPDVCPP